MIVCLGILSIGGFLGLALGAVCAVLWDHEKEDKP